MIRNKNKIGEKQNQYKKIILRKNAYNKQTRRVNPSFNR